MLVALRLCNMQHFYVLICQGSKVHVRYTPFLGEGGRGVSNLNYFIHLCCLVLVPDIERHATLLFYRHIDFLTQCLPWLYYRYGTTFIEGSY